MVLVCLVSLLLAAIQFDRPVPLYSAAGSLLDYSWARGRTTHIVQLDASLSPLLGWGEFGRPKNVPVMGKDPDGNWLIVGVVEWKAIPNSSAPRQGTLRWSHSAWMPDRQQPLLLNKTPESLAWVVQVLVPLEKQEILMRSLRERIQKHGPAFVADLEPVLVRSVQEILPILQQRFSESLDRKQPRIQALAMRYQEELVQGRLVPLLKSEVVPILREHLTPLVDTVGRELFEKASIWGFTWRYLYDVSPLPQRDLVRREFERYLEQDAIPILERHSEDILSALKASSVAIWQNVAVQKLARESASELFRDPELRSILGDVMREAFSDTGPMQEVLRRNWESQAGRRLADSLQTLLEPWLRDTGQELFGTPEAGLTPEMVRVLRSQVLNKDRSWLVATLLDRHQAHPQLQDPWQIRPGPENVLYPLLR
jgi:hypothetical protein